MQQSQLQGRWRCVCGGLLLAPTRVRTCPPMLPHLWPRVELVQRAYGRHEAFCRAAEGLPPGNALWQRHAQAARGIEDGAARDDLGLEAHAQRRTEAAGGPVWGRESAGGKRRRRSRRTRRPRP
eukprot:137871-Chlamydomonas_euryale.AAC.1